MPLPLPTTREPDYIAADLPCAKCGYNLRGLPETGVCPECAVSILDSVLCDKLRYADPRYVRAVEVGALLAAIGALSPVAAIVTGMLAGGFSSRDSVSLGGIVFLGIGTLWIAGWWCLTTRRLGSPPSHSEKERQIARIAVGFQGLVACILLGYEVFGPAGTRTWLGNALGVLAVVSMAALGFSGMSYVAKLTRRTQSAIRYSERARGLAWWTPIAAATLGFANAYRAMGFSAPLPWVVALVIGLGGMVLTLLCWSLTTDLLWRLYAAIREERLSAKVPADPAVERS